MRYIHAYIILLLACVSITDTATAQLLKRIDSIQYRKMHFKHKTFFNNIFQQTINSVKRTPDAGPDESYLIGKSEDPYLPYQGKIIRHITVKTFNFDRSFNDTNQVDNSLGARIGNRFHKSSRKFIIRDNIFVKENTPVNAYKMADNERNIRSLDYIQDARFILDSVDGAPDSVDITVYTKDLFSIAGGAASAGLNHVNTNLYESNLAGMAQRIEVSTLYDYNRTPIWGYGGSYTKRNAFGSFIDVSVGYSSMNNSGFTHTEETTEYIALTRRLVSPYSRFAGGLTLSRNKSYNLYNAPDNVVFKYRYELFDGWAGYAIGIRQLTATNNTIRDRRFLSIRYYNRNFLEEPKQIQNTKYFDPVFNSSQAVLAQFTFYRQDYYKTQYIYGFGTTEDLPYGYNIAVTTGLHRQWHNGMFLERPYAGVNASQYIASGRGDFIQLYLRTGGLLHKGKLQDASYLIGATAYSRIYFLNSTKIRQYVNLSYTHLYNRTTFAPLRINNEYGPRGFLSDSAFGTKRLSLQLETIFFLKFKFLGFQFAPFPYADLSLITPEDGLYVHSSLYTSLGGGFRARNQNLIFETIELRAFFFPVAPTNMRGFKVVVNSNIRFRYRSSYVVAPDLVHLNTE